jgi:hypothetical protein
MHSVDSTRLVASLGVRPPRVAVLIPRIRPWSYLTLFEAALAAQTRVWGGHGNLVFPLTVDLTERDIFWEIAERFDPDMFVVYSPTYADAHEIDPAWHREFVTRQRAAFAAEHGNDTADDLMRQLDSRHVFEGTFEPDWTEPIRRRLTPFHDGDRDHWHIWPASGSTKPSYPLMDATEFLTVPSAIVDRRTTGTIGRLLLTANLGRLTKTTRDALVAREVSVQESEAMSRLDWASAAVESRSRPGADSPWAVAENGTALYQRQPFSTTSALVVGDTAWDFALYYALKRMTGQAWWLPSWLRRHTYYMWRLTHELEHGAASLGRTVVVTSASSPTARDRIAAGLRSPDGAPLGAEAVSWIEVLPEAPARVFERDNQGRAESVPLVDHQTLPLDTPLPRRVATEPETKMRWVTEVSSPQWAAVRHPTLATEILKTRLGATDQVRTSREGVSYLCPNAIILGGESLADNVVRPTLRPLTLLEQLDVIARSAGWSVRQSDKGAYATEAARLFGDPDGLVEALRDPTLRTVFDAYLKKDGVPGKWLSQDGRRYMSWKNLEDLVGAEATERGVPKLLETGVLERGLILKCERCRQKAWYHIETISEHFRCNRCRLDQPVEEHWVEGYEPAWFYRLAEVLLQFLKANGDVPILAVFDTFDRGRPLAHAYELDLYPPSADKLELDIFVAEESRLWIGEANVTGNYSQERLSLVRDVAEVLGAYGVVLATSKPRWPSGTLTAANHVFESAPRLRLRMPSHVERRRAPTADNGQ